MSTLALSSRPWSKKGVLLFDDDHKEQILYTNRGIPHSYVPGHGVDMAFLSSTAPGDWALGDFWGPLASETRSWLDHLSTGRPCALATPLEARRTLEVTLASKKLPIAKRRSGCHWQKMDEVKLLAPGGGLGSPLCLYFHQYFGAAFRS